MATFERVVSAVASGLAVAGLTLLLIMATFTMLDGMLRAFANYPLDFVREIGDLIAAISGAACLPIALLRESNIVLKSLGKVLPALLARGVDLLAALVVEVVMIGMAWQFWLYGVKALRAGEVTWMLNLPRAPFWFVVDGILYFAVLAQAVVVLRRFRGVPEETGPEFTA